MTGMSEMLPTKLIDMYACMHTCVSSLCVHMYSLILFLFLLRYVSLQRLIIAGDHITLPSNVTDLLSIIKYFACVYAGLQSL